MPPRTAEFPRPRNRLLGRLALIAAASLLVPATARAGLFDSLKEATKTFRKIKQEVSSQLGSKPVPASPQPAAAPNTAASQPASQPAPAIPQPAVNTNSAASQPPAANPVGTQSGAVSPASATGNPAPVAVAQKVVGPVLGDNDVAVDNAPAYTVSLHGSHLAEAHMQGSRYVVTVDGVTGPRVDAVLSTYTQFATSGQAYQAVAMSDDGRHYAYEARVRGKIEVIEDGRQILKFPRHGVIQSNNCYLFFSPHGGAHLFFAATQANTTEMEMWVDGKPVPSFDGYSGNPFVFKFSPDGKHYLYAGLPENRSPKRLLVVDGKRMGYPLSGLFLGPEQLRFTADSQHVLYVRTTKYPLEAVFEDGKPVVSGVQEIDSLVTAPKGSSYAVVATGGPNNSQDAVYLNGKEVPGTRGNNNGASDVSHPVARFSPDGKHLAVACNYGAGNAYVVLDGKQGDTYDKIHVGNSESDPNAMKFSPDSRSCGYFADAGSKTFAVVDGHEYDPGFAGAGQIYFSAEGHHVAVIGEKADDSGQVLYIDGKPVSTAHGGFSGSFAFDRDGSHWMIHGQGLVVDGQSLPVSGMTEMPCQFSPDGSEVAVAGVYGPQSQYWGMFLYNTSTRRIQCLTKGDVIDGVFSQIPGNPNDPDNHIVFSPDSKHLYYACSEHVSGQKYSQAMIYIDGEKTGAQLEYGMRVFPSEVQLPPAQISACWQVGADDKLHVLSPVGSEVERITITPPRGGLGVM